MKASLITPMVIISLGQMTQGYILFISNTKILCVCDYRHSV